MTPTAKFFRQKWYFPFRQVLHLRHPLVLNDFNVFFDSLNVHNDGGLSLHTRSLKYGKLSQGTLLQVSPSLIKRRKTHFHRLPCGAHVILGNNGYIWISPGSVSEEGTFGGFAQNLSVVPKDERIVVARLRNTVLALASRGIALWDTSLSYGYDASDGYQPEELLKEEVINEVAQVTKQKLEFVTLEN